MCSFLKFVELTKKFWTGNLPYVQKGFKKSSKIFYNYKTVYLKPQFLISPSRKCREQTLGSDGNLSFREQKFVHFLRSWIKAGNLWNVKGFLAWKSLGCLRVELEHPNTAQIGIFLFLEDYLSNLCHFRVMFLFVLKPLL